MKKPSRKTIFLNKGSKMHIFPADDSVMLQINTRGVLSEVIIPSDSPEALFNIFEFFREYHEYVSDKKFKDKYDSFYIKIDGKDQWGERVFLYGKTKEGKGVSLNEYRDREQAKHAAIESYKRIGKEVPSEIYEEDANLKAVVRTKKLHSR